MCHIITQMIRGKPYAYRVDAHWDKEKKQSRQKRTYLGKIDEVTGEIIPKTAERGISLSKTFGPAYLRANLAEQSGLVDKLRAAFGSKAEAILAAAAMRVIRPEALRNLQPLLEESYLPELIGLEKDLSSQRMSELLISIGKDDQAPPWTGIREVHGRPRRVVVLHPSAMEKTNRESRTGRLLEPGEELLDLQASCQKRCRSHDAFVVAIHKVLEGLQRYFSIDIQGSGACRDISITPKASAEVDGRRLPGFI